MAIDRIGKSGPPTPAAETGGPIHPKDVARPFEVARDAAVSAAAVSSGALEQLRSGRIDLQGYLDVKVAEATAHLTGLPAVELDAIRSALRDRLSTDPTLVDLARSVAGDP
jgi:hypothetical protein